MKTRKPTFHEKRVRFFLILFSSIGMLAAAGLIVLFNWLSNPVR
jgi:hypothetical protein